MVIVGLLVIALACVIVGMKLASAAWLIASLIATGGAAYLLVTNLARGRRAIAHPAGPADATADRPADAESDRVEPAGSAAATQPAADSAAETNLLPAVTRRADTPHAATPRAAAPAQRDVWVIDGRPRYHLEGCAIIKGQDAEPIPWEQATEDGFMPCSLCEPDSILAGS